MSSSDLVVLEYIPELVRGVTPDNGTRASSTLTAAGQPANNDTVTLDGVVYTFVTVLVSTANRVKIGTTAAESLANLKAAINRAAGAGSKYGALTTRHETVDATTLTATTLKIEARHTGDAYNTVPTVESSANLSFSSATLTGGVQSTITEWKALRYVSESVNFSIENTQSAEVRPDRTQTDLIQTSASAGGDVNVELSYSSYDDFFAMALCDSWSGNVLENGVTPSFMTFRKHFPDTTPQQYQLFRGTCVEGFQFEMQLGQIVSGNFNLMSFGIDPLTGLMSVGIDGETHVAAPTTMAMNAVTNFQDFLIDGVPYSGCISSMSLQLKNGLRAIMCLGSLTASDMKLGTLEVSGNMEFYFNDDSNMKKFVKGTEFGVSFALQDVDGNRLLIEMPRCKFETGEAPAGGKNTDVMFSSSYRALYSPTAGYVIRITRTPA